MCKRGTALKHRLSSTYHPGSFPIEKFSILGVEREEKYDLARSYEMKEKAYVIKRNPLQNFRL